MSLRSKILPVLSLTFAVGAFSAFTFAQDTTPTAPAQGKAERKFKGDRGMMGDRAFGGRHGKRGPGFELRGINLTDDQKAKIKSIREANKPDQATITELRTIREGRKNGTAITPEQQARMKEFRDQSMAKMKAAHEQILAILTPEQKAQIETRKTEMRQRFEDRKANRKGRPAPPAVEKPKSN
ncbi:MAG: Spy/CpxP family protein refolding chaperone [Pyrinomonadaceae bacterium]